MWPLNEIRIDYTGEIADKWSLSRINIIPFQRSCKTWVYLYQFGTGKWLLICLKAIFSFRKCNRNDIKNALQISFFFCFFVSFFVKYENVLFHCYIMASWMKNLFVFNNSQKYCSMPSICALSNFVFHPSIVGVHPFITHECYN